MTMFRARHDRSRMPRLAAVRRRLVVGLLALSLLAGCTTIAGNPLADTYSVDGPDMPASGRHGDGPEAPPTSSELIAAALASGEIDEPTSWLYRTWAAFDDSQLPERFLGSPEGHDIELLTALPPQLNELPDDIRAKVEPYFLRPTDPRSAYSVGADDPPGLRRPVSALANAPAPDPYWDKCHEGWDTEVVPGVPFRVWACKDLDFADVEKDSVTRNALQAVSKIVAAHAPRMIADMGDVIPDNPKANPEPRSDDLIDIYVVQPHRQSVQRDGDTGILNAGGLTVSAHPYDGATSSAYVMVPVDVVGDADRLAWSVVHELFHVLQYTHHFDVSSRWIYDSTADWASSYYLRGSTSALIHQVRLPVKQDDWAASLAHEVGYHPYGAYVWPLFMEQQVGAASVFATWKALAAEPRGAGDQAVIKALDQQLAVAGNYPEFAMRLLNAKGLPGDPIKPRFVNLDSGFPDGRLPDLIEGTLGEGPWHSVFTMGGLSYRPYRIAVPASPGRSPDDGILVSVTGKVRPGSASEPTLEGVIRGPDRNYRRQPISYTSGDTICVAEDMFLVLSHSSTRQEDTAVGQFTLTRVKDEDQVTDKACSRVEVNHPEWLHRLDDGEKVEVDGVENDGKLDTTAVAISVHDVDREIAHEYRVEATVAGGTLHAERSFSWALTEFDEVGSQHWRKIEPLPLDIDLTDENRPLTIDARLTRVGRHVDQHTPTIGLYGAKPCGVDDPDEVCELVGDLTFNFTGDYDQGPNIHPRLYAKANIAATLSVRLSAPEKRPFGGFQYFDAGSTWTLTGSARFEECGTIQVETCPGAVEQTFAHASSFPPGDWVPEKLRFSIAHASVFSARIPVVVTSTGPSGPGEAPIDPIEQQVWDIACPATPEDDQYGGRFWESGGSYTSNVFEHSDVWAGGAPAAWSDGRPSSEAIGTELVIDCSRTWTDKDFNLSRSGGTATVSTTLHGTLHWVPK